MNMEKTTDEKITIKFPISNQKVESEGGFKVVDVEKSMVLIGANGAGKTRLSVWVEEHNENVHRISAQKSLNMPERVDVTDRSFAWDQLLLGDGFNVNKTDWQYSKHTFRWGDHPVTFLQNDYERLLKFLLADKASVSMKFCEMYDKGYKDYPHIALIDKVKSIWDAVIEHKELILHNGHIEVKNLVGTTGNNNTSNDENFNGSELSDGERAVFYYIGEAISAKPGSLIIVDEPENHLHRAILVNLWNRIENVRNDCKFMYITHDMDFACSRNQSILVWVKKMPELNCWDYDIVKDDETKIDSLYLEIAGSRQKVILVEGQVNNSLDIRLYSALYKEYNIIPAGGWFKVIQSVKAANSSLWNLHHLDVKGIIDRDTRSEKEIKNYKNENIYVLHVSEIENLFMLPEVIQFMCKDVRADSSFEDALNEIKEAVFKWLSDNRNNQLKDYLKSRVSAQLESQIGECKDIASLKSMLDSVNQELLNPWIEEREKCIDRILAEKDYIGALQLIKMKKLLFIVGVPEKLGINKNVYRERVISAIESYQEDDSNLDDEDKARNKRIGNLISSLKAQIGIV